MSLLAARALSLTLGQPLFTDLSFAIEPGDRLGLVAANGRGKSSLLACLAGMAEPTACGSSSPSGASPSRCG